jgi:signal transduction histidine kinase
MRDNQTKLPTKYAPAERASAEELKKQIELFRRKHVATFIIEHIPVFITILNKYRQIVYANEAFLKFLGVEKEEDVLGLRPGEAVHCIHAYEDEGGCGTTEFCRYCGAVNAILDAQRGIPNEKECLITQENHNVLDLLVWANPIEIDGEQFTVFTMRDIQHLNRRRALERIFFHDVLNTAGALRSFSSLILESDDPEEIKELSEYIRQITDKIIEEIKSQKDLLAAENDDLEIEISKINSLELLKTLKIFYKDSILAEDKEIIIDPNSKEITFYSDESLVRRVISNMLKNALEASKKGERVTLGCKEVENGIEFFVHNPDYIPPRIQLQIFNRSFSTKGKNRGLGTYSMKLLTEKYLQGRVSFVTDKEKGTTFFAKFKNLSEEKSESEHSDNRH